MAGFRVIVADPPWRYSDSLTMSDVKRGAEANYQGTMTMEQIAAVPVARLADKDAAVCVLWIGNPILPFGFSILSAWGFEFKQSWHWVKTKKRLADVEPDRVIDELEESDLAFPMGRLSRMCTETMLVGVRGKIYPHLRSKRERNVLPHPSLPHSCKPETLQDRLERMFPEGERLELFARRARPGWRCLGNECPDTLGEDIFDSCDRLLGIDPGRQSPLFPEATS